MIKLTRGALTMLLAQYRGILKNAWIKNFAVAAALATTVTTAYADPAEVTTWDDAVKTGEGAVALNGTAGVLNIQADKKWQKEPSTIVITGGTGHKIGGGGKNVNLFAEEKNKDNYPTGNITIDTTGEGASPAMLTIATKDTHTTGVALDSVVVKAGSEDSDATANLTVSNKPTSPTPNGYDDDQYTNIQKLTVDGKQASVNVTGTGELDVNENLTIKNGAKVEVAANGNLWVGISDVDAPSVNVENGSLISKGELDIDSSKLTVGEDGKVEVQGKLSLADVGPVNINTLTKLASDTESKAKITLTGETDFEGNDLTLNKKIEKDTTNYVKSLSAQNVTLGGSEYYNNGLVKEVTVGSKLTASAVKEVESKTVADTYKIGSGESITLNTSFNVDDGLYANKSGKGEVASDLDVAGGTLNVQAGEWTAKNITVSAGALNVNGKSLAADGLSVINGNAIVAENAALALKTLNIAKDKALTVNAAGVLDLTNAKLVNDTAGTDVKGTIDNSGIVKIGGDTLAKAIANGEKDKGYIFNNKAGAEIQVAGPATLATGAFITGSEDPKVAGIKNDGTLAVNGALTVKGDEKGVSTLANAGTIKAASLQLNGKAGDPAKEAVDDSKFTLAAGTYEITGAVGANTDTLAIDTGATVNAQSIGARILEITGTAGADADHKVGTITAAEIDLSGTVNAGNVEATKDLTVTAGATTVEGVLTAAKLTQNGGTIIVKKGALNATEATVKGTTLEGATANIGTLAVASSSGEKALDLKKSTATVGSFNGDGAQAGSISVGEGSTLTITANQTDVSEKDNAIFKNNATGDAITGKGTLAVNAGALGLEQNEAKDNYVTADSGKFAKGSIGVLKINGADSAIGADKINKDNLVKLITKLSVNDSEKFDGKLQLVGVTADIGDAQETTDAKNGSYKKDDVDVFAQLAGDTTLQSVTVDAGNGTSAVSGDLGNLVASANAGKVSIAEATLQGSGSSEETKGFYVSQLKADSGEDAKKVKLAGAELADDEGSSLTLAGQGKIGAVTAAYDGRGALNVTGNANVVKVVTEGDKEVVKAENIGTDSENLAKVNVSGALTAANIYTKALESSGSVTAANIEAGKATVEGGVVNATNLKTSDVATIKAGSVNVGDAEFTGALTMEGGALTATENTDTSAAGKVTLKAASEIKAGSITAKDLVAENALTSAGNITADKLDAQSTVDLTGGEVKAAEVSLGGETKITGGASLIAGDLTATSQTITVGEDGDEGSAGFLFAKNIIGADKIVIDPEFSQGVALGGTTAFNRGNELTTNIVVGQNSIFAYDENLTAEQLKSLASKYTLSDAENGVGSLLVVNSAIDLNGHGINVGKDQATATPGANKLLLGENGALAVGGTALANANLANATPKAAVTATSGVEYDKTSKVLLDGGVKAGAQYQIFDGAVAANATSADADLTASSLNGFYTATISDDGKTSKINANRGVMYQMTEPLYQHMLAVTGNGNTGAGVQFLEKTASEARDGGKDAETVARLGAFGGLYNAAYNVNKTSADAIAARTAMGNNGVQQVATNNAIGGAVWLSPIYKNVKADSLESDGKESGADVKLTGVALGADVTTANNVRLGAMFNLGSGDTDGNKLGSRAENDFDYFGFGVYAAYNYGNFGVAADATYAKVDNDLSASSSLGYGYFKSSVDTNVYSLGLTAKYAFDTNFATITPHAGIRYTSLNADSYDVESAYGTLATTSYDSASVVSFPVGVTFTKDIKVNAWKVQPTFDVTLTANAGDTEAEYDTYFTGADSKVKLESEFVDSFTYGLTAGFEAQHESGVALGLGVNYEGSSNTNSYGVTGNVRYTF